MPVGTKISEHRAKEIASLMIAFTNVHPMWQAQKDITRFIIENFLERIIEETPVGTTNEEDNNGTA